MIRNKSQISLLSTSKNRGSPDPHIEDLLPLEFLGYLNFMPAGFQILSFSMKLWDCIESTLILNNYTLSRD